MFGIAFNGSCQSQYLIFGKAFGDSCFRHTKIAFSQCSGFIKYDHIHQAHFFKSKSVAHQDPVRRANSGCDRNHKRDSQSQCVRTGNDQNRRDTFDNANIETCSNYPGDCRNNGCAQCI